MKGYVLADEHRHISIRSLALLAARRGDLVASAGTWYRWITARGWKRLSRRLYPAKPKVYARTERSEVRARRPEGSEDSKRSIRPRGA